MPKTNGIHYSTTRVELNGLIFDSSKINPVPCLGENLTKEELYAEIKKSSKESYILQEMNELGFWDGEKPKLESELVQIKISLQKELDLLSKKIQDPKEAVGQIHQKRKEEAKQRREETKQRHEQKAKELQRKRALKKENEIGFIGHEHIDDMSDKVYDAHRLLQNTLFVIEDAKDLANKMGLALGELRFLVYSQKLSRHTHYTRFKIAKKSGGYREISAPMPKLKKAQRWILEQILQKVEISDVANGFVRDRSIVTNAQKHVGKSVVINCDLKDFFPTIGYPRVKGVFKALGYSSEVSALLALLCTEPEQKQIVLDGEKLFLYTRKRYLPQGSPASPALTNIICRRVDVRLSAIAEKNSFEYSRYADDITLSSMRYEKIGKMLRWVEKIVTEEGFVLHPEKTRIMKKGTSQEVTGVKVNEKLSVDKRELKRFRALVHQIEQSGPEGKQWNGKSDNLLFVLWGYLSYVAMIDPQKAAPYQMRVKRLLERYAPTHTLPSERKEKSKQSVAGRFISLFRGKGGRA